MDDAVVARDQVHRRRRHERSDRDGLRVRDLRDALDAVLQAVRRRARGGDPDRRHDRPRRAPARDDEAARRLELVPARAGSSGCPGWTSGELELDRRAGAEPRTHAAGARSRSAASAPPASPASSLIAILALGLAYVKLASGGNTVSVPAGAEGRPADPASVPLRHGAGQLRRRLRHPRRPREPDQARFSADRPARHPDQGAARPILALPVFRLEGGPGHQQHDVPRRPAGSPTTTTSSSSATAASTAPSGSTAPRSSSALKHSTDFLGQKSYHAYIAGVSRLRQPGSSRTASISPATRCPSRSTTSRPPAGPSATAASTSSARAPARGSR